MVIILIPKDLQLLSKYQKLTPDQSKMIKEIEKKKINILINI